MRRLVGWARRVSGTAACGPVAVLSGRAETVDLSPGEATDELVVGAGSLVVKQHAEALPRGTLLLADRRRDIFVPPLASSTVGGHPVTLWPRGVPVREADLHGPGPWAAAGGLLATLHRTPPPPGMPPCGAPARVERALGRLAAGPPGIRSKIICDALSTALVPHARPATLVHGDFHLGQVVSFGGARRLIDVDTVGLGDPAWDLARMAAWYLAGVIPGEAWTVFLTAYGAAGGPAVVPGADPWPVLDPYARLLAAQTAAVAVVNQDLDTAETFVAACRRMLALARSR